MKVIQHVSLLNQQNIFDSSHFLFFFSFVCFVLFRAFVVVLFRAFVVVLFRAFVVVGRFGTEPTYAYS